MNPWDYNDTITYWGAPIMDGWGTKSFSDPVVVKGYWQDRAERFIDGNGEETVSRSIVWMPIPFEMGGFLYKGMSAAADPTTVRGADPIRAKIETSDFGRLFVERRAFL